MKTMTQKFTLMILMILLLGAASYGQTASLASVTASPGESISVPLTVTNFSNIGSISFDIRFNPILLTFTGISGAAVPGFSAWVTDSTIHVAWYATPPAYLTIASGLLLNLNFIYNGMDPAPLTFLGSCEVTQMPGPVIVNVTYTSGSISPNTLNPQTAAIISASATTGNPVNVPLRFEGFASNVGAITQKIHYDVNKLSFISITPQGTLTGAIAAAYNGIVTITWTNTGGTGINWSGGNQIILTFLYTGSITTNLDFYAGSLITTNVGVNIPVSYTDGIVSPGTPIGSVVIGSVSNAIQGQDYELPVTLSGFPSGIPNGAAAFTLNYIFDSPTLSFLGITNPNPFVPVIFNQTGNTISMVWTNGSAPNINGQLLKLKFKYNGIGNADVDFNDGCLFSDFMGATIHTSYTGGDITPAQVSADAQICDTIHGSNNTDILVPVYFDGLPPNMGAVTLFIGFNTDKLTYIGIENALPGTNANLSNNKIIIAWSSSTPTNLNGKFLDLKFQYHTAGTCGASVWFVSGCELADINANIVPANWLEGGINVKFKISGFLRYNGAPRPDTITLRNVKIYLKTNPGAVTIDSAMTDGAAYYSFYAANGAYTLNPTCTKPHGGLTSVDALAIQLKIAIGQPFPYENALRLLAADVNQSGTITSTDALLIKLRIVGIPTPTLTAPNWLFETPAIMVNCAGLNQNIWGICSGDVNGSYVNPIP